MYKHIIIIIHIVFLFLFYFVCDVDGIACQRVPLNLLRLIKVLICLLLCVLFFTVFKLGETFVMCL